MRWFISYIAALLALAPTSCAFYAFPVAQRRSVQRIFPSQRQFSSTRSPLQDDQDSDSQPEKSSIEADAQKQDLLATLGELETLQARIEEATDRETLQSLQPAVQSAQVEVDRQLSMLVPPAGLSVSEYAATMLMYAKLPIRSRIGFCKALDVSNPIEAALDFERIPEIATLLYEERAILTPFKIKSAMKSTESLVFSGKSYGSTSTSALTTASPSKAEADQKAGVLSSSSSTLFGQIQQQDQDPLKQLIEQTFGRVTRQEGRVATRKDLETLQAALQKNRDVFVVSAAHDIPGGYLLLGTPNSKMEPSGLIKAIDQKLPSQWPCQVSYIQDFTATVRGQGENLNEPALLLLHKDISPQPKPIVRIISNLAALSTAFLFSIGVYGGNKLVMDQLEERSATGDYVGFAWFTERTLEVFLPILAIQLVHELGHLLTQKRYDLKTLSLPTLLPGWGLPFLGCQNSFVESPPSRTALFDFAVAGPLLGLIAAMGFFVFGLQLTNAADPETIKYLPALPVDVLRSSTLGGSLIDTFLGGGQGFITLQDPKMSIPLHPFAIAGFTGILSNALALLPLGSTDGGRMSTTILGRPGQLLMSAAVWFFLLIASFSFERADALIGAWVVYNIVQNDLEIPCREEVSEVDALRAVFAFGLWFVALLAIVPMQ